MSTVTRNDDIKNETRLIYLLLSTIENENKWQEENTKCQHDNPPDDINNAIE